LVQDLEQHSSYDLQACPAGEQQVPPMQVLLQHFQPSSHPEPLAAQQTPFSQALLAHSA
jgi:hypothetical protein